MRSARRAQHIARFVKESEYDRCDDAHARQIDTFVEVGLEGGKREGEPPDAALGIGRYLRHQGRLPVRRLRQSGGSGAASGT